MYLYELYFVAFHFVVFHVVFSELFASYFIPINREEKSDIISVLLKILNDFLQGYLLIRDESERRSYIYL